MFKTKMGVFGVPRSGTTWLGQIFNSHPDVVYRYQPLFSYGHKGRLTEASTEREISLFFDEINVSQDDYTLMKSESQRGTPSFPKSIEPTHLAFKETRYLHIIENMLERCSDIKIIGIIRNPLTTLASWVKAPREFQSDWDIKQEWRFAPSKNQNKIEEFNGFAKWKEAASEFLKFQKKYSQQFLLLRYEKLKTNPHIITNDLFRFCGLKYDRQVDEFIRRSQAIHDPNPYSVFRNKTTGDNWKNILPTEISDCIISELNNTPLSIFLDD